MFIDELKTYITTNTSLVFGTTLFIGNMPEGINNCVVLQQMQTENTYNMGNRLGHYTTNISVRVRGGQVENTAMTLANTIQVALENLTTSLTHYRIVRGAFESPMYQLDGTDENNNYIFVGMYQCIVENL